MTACTEMDEDDVEILVPGSEEEEERRMRLHAKEVKSVIAKIGVGISCFAQSWVSLAYGTAPAITIVARL